MKILLNDENYEIAENTSITMLFQKLGKEDLRGWAVAAFRRRFGETTHPKACSQCFGNFLSFRLNTQRSLV
jgi:hypothetical protein